MRLKFIRVGLFVDLANHYTTRGAQTTKRVDYLNVISA